MQEKQYVPVEPFPIDVEAGKAEGKKTVGNWVTCRKGRKKKEKIVTQTEEKRRRQARGKREDRAPGKKENVAMFAGQGKSQGKKTKN